MIPAAGVCPRTLGFSDALAWGIDARMRHLVTASLCFVLSMWGGSARAGGFAVNLYTIGPSSELMSRYGHSALCVSRAGDDDGRCYDYGVTRSSSFFDVAWSALRERPGFVPTEVPERTLIAAFRDQGRRIERQRLPLPDTEAAALATLLQRDVREQRAYAYHPYWNNCSTQLRDRLDEAMAGHLRQLGTPWTDRTFRQLAETGLSGRLPELSLMALGLGAPNNDRAPSRWEAMFLPDALRDTVHERLGVAPEQLHEQVGITLATSVHAGRMALVLLGLSLFALLRLGPRWLARRTTLVLAGAALGASALFVEALSIAALWEEIRWNWALLVLLPTDLLIAWLPPKWRHTYARARLALTGLLTIASLLGLIAQPLWAIAALVALPLYEVLRGARPGRA